MKLIFPTILIIISILALFKFVGPTYKEINSLRNDINSHDSTLANTATMQEKSNNIINSYKSITDTDKEKLLKLLPDSINNIKFILEIDKMASSYGVNISNVKFDDDNQKSSSSDPNTLTEIAEDSSSYGSSSLEFTAGGSYESIISFIKEMEGNLHLIGIKSVSFSSAEQVGGIYNFNIKVETYWLK